MLARHDIKIVGVKIVRDPKPNKGGSIVVANFDCEANGLLMIGCALVRTGRGGLVVWSPCLEKYDPRRGVKIIDNTLRNQLLGAARDAYRSLGGHEAEWIPRAGAGDDADRESSAAQGHEDTEGVQRFLAGALA